jgi:hypothetical protein
VRVVLALSLLWIGACASDGPHIESVMPEEGSAGDEVTLAGDGFCGAGDCDPLPTGYVSFGIDPQIDGVVTAWSEGEIRAEVPQSVAPGEILIVVTVDGRSSNGVRFVVR